MLKKIAGCTMVIMMAGFFLVPVVMAQVCPFCLPGPCQDPEQHQYRSRVSEQTQNGKMLQRAPDYCTVYLYEKDPTTWDVIGNGGVAMMKYMPEATVFYFQLMARKLLPETEYTLIYYPDPWPGSGLICLGSGCSDEYGGLRINGYYCPTNPNYSPPISTGNMPAPGDENYGYGAKIWLVLSSDVDCVNQQMIAWQPTTYLFENALISFVDSDN